MATKVTVDPITRIEGHLSIECDVDGGKVIDARTTGTLFRGLELILQGHDPRDAQDYVQRICSVCPVTHGTAAAFALDDAFGLTGQIPENGRIVRNLILGANYLHSHILHFYHLAALDYVTAPNLPPLVPQYAGDYRLPPAVNAAAVQHYLQALEMRKLAHTLLATWGGRIPGQRGIVPGGSTANVDTEKIVQSKFLLGTITDFIKNAYIPDVLEVAKVYSDWASIGAGCKNFMSYGGFPQDNNGWNGKRFYSNGVYVDGQAGAFDPTQIGEDVQYSWYQDGIPKDPYQSVITPEADKAAGYTWLKAPRYGGKVVEVGPLAKLFINQDPTLLGVLTTLGLKTENAFSVIGRHAARAVDCLNVATAMGAWLGQLTPGGPTCVPNEVPQHAKGMGLNDAERGALGHWIKIYNAIVPTTWNASPRDDNGQLGPMEQALVGTPVADVNNPIELVRVVRSFDPCLACAIHLITPDRKVRKFRVY
jgi:hydrogenase large subunit